MHLSRKRILALTGLFASIATVAFAYILVGALFSGEGSTTGGTVETQSYPMTVVINPGFLPGAENNKQIKLSINNTTGHPLFAHSMETSISSSSPEACPASWFKIIPQQPVDKELLEGVGGKYNPVFEIAVGEGTTKDGTPNTEWQPNGGALELEEAELKETNQIGCAGVTLKVHVTLNAGAS